MDCLDRCVGGEGGSRGLAMTMAMASIIHTCIHIHIRTLNGSDTDSHAYLPLYLASYIHTYLLTLCTLVTYSYTYIHTWIPRTFALLIVSLCLFLLVDLIRFYLGEMKDAQCLDLYWPTRAGAGRVMSCMSWQRSAAQSAALLSPKASWGTCVCI